jgi:hypothetical protein
VRGSFSLVTEGIRGDLRVPIKTSATRITESSPRQRPLARLSTRGGIRTRWVTVYSQAAFAGVRSSFGSIAGRNQQGSRQGFAETMAHALPLSYAGRKRPAAGFEPATVRLNVVPTAFGSSADSANFCCLCSGSGRPGRHKVRPYG